jgi:hypothetical protein
LVPEPWLKVAVFPVLQASAVAEATVDDGASLPTLQVLQQQICGNQPAATASVRNSASLRAVRRDASDPAFLSD